MGKISKLHQLLEDRQISCRELTETYLSEIEKANGALNAYVNVTADKALETAQIVDKKISSGESLQPLEGIPMTLKDNISTKDIETTCCSKILKGYKPMYDATVCGDVAKAKCRFCLGKTNMSPNLRWVPLVKPLCFGGAHNPHNVNHCAGGSSGGVASAVCGNIAAYGLGSDTRRIYSSACKFLRYCWLKTNIRHGVPLWLNRLCKQLGSNRSDYFFGRGCRAGV